MSVPMRKNTAKTFKAISVQSGMKEVLLIPHFRRQINRSFLNSYPAACGFPWERPAGTVNPQEESLQSHFAIGSVKTSVYLKINPWCGVHCGAQMAFSSDSFPLGGSCGMFGVHFIYFRRRLGVYCFTLTNIYEYIKKLISLHEKFTCCGMKWMHIEIH
jgi:hypothetical protein